MTQAGNSGGVERPRCACHGEPMYLGRRAGAFICAVDERERNARRIRISAGGAELFVGRAPTLEVTEAFRGFIQQHRQEVKDGWLHS